MPTKSRGARTRSDIEPKAKHHDNARSGQGDEAAKGHRIPTYEEFRTQLTFAQVRQMLWVQSSDPKDWRYKRRNTVLGLWRQIKREMYAEMLAWADSYDDAKGTA